MIARRRLAVTLVLVFSALVTVATSPPRSIFPGLEASHEARVLLDTAEPSFTTHLTVRLEASQNGVAPDGGVRSSSLSAIANGCLVGVDAFDDAGVCVEVKDFDDRPKLAVSLVLDGPDGGSASGPVSVTHPLFEGCGVGSPCEQGVTVKVALAPGETRPTMVTLEVRATAQGGTVDRAAGNQLTISQP